MVKKITLIVLRVLLGCVFVFSGFVKAIDPLGFTYKMEDYFKAMGPFFENFTSLAFVAAIVLSAIELVIGVNYIFGVRLKETNWAATLFMLVMTPLTLWIALANPVHDCGCFGEALIISNWATFWKNIAISVMIGLIFLLQKSHRPFIGSKSQWAFVVYTFIFSLGLSLYCYMHLPIIDFRPYKIGANINEGMLIPENAEIDSFDIKLIYAKNGVEKEFSLENYPTDDTWTFVDQRSILVKKGYEPPIHDFTMDDLEQGDITDIVLGDESYTFLLVSYDFALADLSKSEEINKIYKFAKEKGYAFYAMTASVDQDIQKYKLATKAVYPICLTDKITLKTIVRSNPGLVLIKNATVLNKWHFNDLPEFTNSLEESPLGEMKKPDQTKKLGMVILLFFIPALLIIGLDRRSVKKKY